MLALRMGRTVDELYRTMSSAEFSMWVALHNEDRWGEDNADQRADFRAGLVCSTVANFAGKSMKSNVKPLAPADFMPSLAVPEKVVELDPVTFFTAVAASKKFNK
jgi:hypothetical protein